MHSAEPSFSHGGVLDPKLISLHQLNKSQQIADIILYLILLWFTISYLQEKIQ